MQALALQFNLSETTFVLPFDRGDGARAHLHADVRDAVRRSSDARHRARRARRCAAPGDAVTLEMRAGVIPVYARRRRLDAAGQSAAASAGRRPRAPSSRRCSVLAEADVAPDPAAPPLWVDTGSEQLVIPLASADAVRRAAPRADLLLQHGQHRRSARWPTSSRRTRSATRRRRTRGRRALLLPEARRRRSRIPAPAPRAPTSAAGCSRPAHRCRSGSPSRRAMRSARPCRLGLEVTADRQDSRVRPRRSSSRRGHA